MIYPKEQYPNGLASYREQQKKAAVERHRQTLELEKQQAERAATEAAALELTERQTIAATVEHGLQSMQELQPGDIYAMSKVKAAVYDIYTVLQYLLKSQSQTAPEVVERETDPDTATGYTQAAAGEEIQEQGETSNDDVQRYNKNPKRPGRPRKNDNIPKEE